MMERLSSAEQCEQCLAAIAEHDSVLNAFVTPTVSEARESAKRADEAAMQGKRLGLLHGMPIALKDNIDTAGIRTTSGASFLRDRIAQADATVVRRLKAAGAVVMGKTTLGELVFDIRSHNPVTGTPRNPWNLNRSPGGSSGGSAAAIAANMTIGALGSDTGGSIRLPAAHCGVSGLRPTHGAVPGTGASAVSRQFDTLGPMARRAIDVARIFAVIAGFDAADPYSRTHEYADFLNTLHNGVNGLRIGIPQNFFFEDVSSEITAAVVTVADSLRAAGAQLIELELPDADKTHAQSSVLLYADIAAYHRETLKMPNAITPMVHERISRGLKVSGTDYSDAMHFKARWQRTLKSAFENVDILLTPTTPTEALPNDGTADDLHSLTARVARFTYAGTLGGIPGLSIPCGFTRAGLPIGAMLQARWWNEPSLFRAAVAFQAATDWHLREAIGTQGA